MRYKGIELAEFTRNRPVVFDPPKMMLVWDSEGAMPHLSEVHAYLPERFYPVQGADAEWTHCAEVPLERAVTKRELAMWLANGNGQAMLQADRLPLKPRVVTQFSYPCGEDDLPLSPTTRVRMWRDNEWAEPTREYLMIGD